MGKHFLGNSSCDLVGVRGSSYLLSPFVILSCVRSEGPPIFSGSLPFYLPPRISWESDLSEHFTKLPRLN